MPTIRTVREFDILDLLAIYVSLCPNTAMNMRCQVLKNFKEELKTLLKYPYLVLEEGKIFGICHVSTYYDRRAYDWSVEVSLTCIKTKVEG